MGDFKCIQMLTNFIPRELATGEVLPGKRAQNLCKLKDIPKSRRHTWALGNPGYIRYLIYGIQKGIMIPRITSYVHYPRGRGEPKTKNNEKNRFYNTEASCSKRAGYIPTLFLFLSLNKRHVSRMVFLSKIFFHKKKNKRPMRYQTPPDLPKTHINASPIVDIMALPK